MLPISNEYRALRGHFAAIDNDEDRALNESRGYACEVVAWRFVTHLSWVESIHYLLYELPYFSADGPQDEEAQAGRENPSTPRSATDHANENTPLLPHSAVPHKKKRLVESQDHFNSGTFEGDRDQVTSSHDLVLFGGLNALELAAVSGAKKFLSQRVVQKVIDAIWRGDIVFWETLSVDSIKEARIYNKKSVSHLIDFSTIHVYLKHSRPEVCYERRVSFPEENEEVLDRWRPAFFAGIVSIRSC